MNNIAIIENEVIVNVVVGDLEWALAAFPDAEVLECPDGAGIGWTRSGGEWFPPGGSEPVELPVIVITNMTVSDDPRGVARIAPDFTTLKMPVGATVTIDAELRYAGQVVPLTQDFAMPLRSTDGFKRFINVQFVNGLTTFSATMTDSKRWEVDKALINSDLPPEAHMDFAGVVITAVE